MERHPRDTYRFKVLLKMSISSKQYTHSQYGLCPKSNGFPYTTAKGRWEWCRTPANPTAWELEAGGSEAQIQPWLHSECKTRLGYTRKERERKNNPKIRKEPQKPGQSKYFSKKKRPKTS